MNPPIKPTFGRRLNINPRKVSIFPSQIKLLQIPGMSPPSENPSASSSSGEEEEFASDSEETPTASPRNHVIPELHGDDDSAEGEESDNDDDDDDDEKTVPSPNISDFTVKSISINRHNIPSSSKSIAVLPEDDNDDDDGDGNKRKRVSELVNGAAELGPSAKRGTGGIQRIWSLDDEVVILEGMAEYKDTTGVEPYGDMVRFHEFIKYRLHISVSKNQLMDKIRRMRKKFLSNNDDWFLSKPHEHRAFEISKKIWGEDKMIFSYTGEEEDDDVGKSKGKGFSSSSGKRMVKSDGILVLPVQEASERKQEVTAKKQKIGEAVEPSFLWMDDVIKFAKQLGGGTFDDGFIREGTKLVASSKLKALNDKWGKIKQEAAELHLKRLDLIRGETKLILDALNHKVTFGDV